MPAPSTYAVAGPPTVPAGLPASSRIADYAMMALAVIVGGGSLVLFAWPGRPTLVRMDLSPDGALWWNAFLSMVFFVQHSVLVRRPVRARLMTLIPSRYDPAFYAITSGLVLALVVMLFQPAGPPFFVLHGVPRMLAIAASAAAIAVFTWGIVTLHTFDPFGLRPIRRHLHLSGDSEATPGRANEFVVRGPYRWVRHPLYSAIVVLLWADPDMNPGRLELAALWSAWIYVGARLEERDLIADFGATYRRYRERVPMLIPWRRPIRETTWE